VKVVESGIAWQEVVALILLPDTDIFVIMPVSSTTEAEQVNAEPRKSCLHLLRDFYRPDDPQGKIRLADLRPYFMRRNIYQRLLLILRKKDRDSPGSVVYARYEPNCDKGY
jgi:hypothetical protein